MPIFKTTFTVLLLALMLAFSGGAVGQPQNSEPVFDPPDFCEVQPSRPDLQCFKREEQSCYGQHCSFTNGPNPEDVGWDCDWVFLEACIIDVPDKCPNVPAVFEETSCSRCMPMPTHEAVCQLRIPVFKIKRRIACEAGGTPLMDSEFWSCGPCQPVRPPGEYKTCSCDDEEWLEFCPQGNSPESPVPPPHPCELAPQFCNSAEPLDN